MLQYEDATVEGKVEYENATAERKVEYEDATVGTGTIRRYYCTLYSSRYILYSICR